MTTLDAETDVKVDVYYLCFYLTMCLSLVGRHGKRYHSGMENIRILVSRESFKAAVNGTDKRDSIAAGLALYM